MKKTSINQINDLYNTLVDLGVLFYYGNEIIAIGEITDIEFMINDQVKVELNGFEEYLITLEEFEENHYKTGVNYHSWESVRAFDSLISQ